MGTAVVTATVIVAHLAVFWSVLVITVVKLYTFLIFYLPEDHNFRGICKAVMSSVIPGNWPHAAARLCRSWRLCCIEGTRVFCRHRVGQSASSESTWTSSVSPCKLRRLGKSLEPVHGKFGVIAMVLDSQLHIWLSQSLLCDSSGQVLHMCASVTSPSIIIRYWPKGCSSVWQREWELFTIG